MMYQETHRTIRKKPIYNWFALYTKPNGEKKICSALEEKNIECYLPVKKMLRHWSDRKKWIEEPLFRSYVFVRVSYIEFFNALGIPGVVRYVSFGGKAFPIPDEQIENIKTLIEQEKLEIILTRENIKKGAKAEVLYGPMKGVTGEVIKLNGQYRILLRVESMGYCLYTNVSKDEVRFLKPDSLKKQDMNKLRKRNYNRL